MLLHLSDLHFGSKNRFSGDDPTKLGEAFCRALMAAHKDSSLPDAEKVALVIVTGDIAESGLKSEFKTALEFFVALASGLELARDRFVFLPGNHDISWAGCRIIRASLDNEDFPASELDGRIAAGKLANYYNFLAQFYEVPIPYQSLGNLENCRALARGGWLRDFPELRLSVAALNTSEREHDVLKGGFLSSEQAQSLMNVWEESEYSTALKIVALHHNPVAAARDNQRWTIDWVREKEEKAGAPLPMSADVFAHYSADLAGFEGSEHLPNIVSDVHPQLILHGHHHDQGVPSSWHWKGGGSAPVLSVGSFGLRNDELPGGAPLSCQFLHFVLPPEPQAPRLEAIPLVYDGRFRLQGQVLDGAFRIEQNSRGAYSQALPLPSGWEAKPVKSRKTRQSVKGRTKVTPGIDLLAYREALRGAHGNLRLESLDADPSHQPMKLWNIFVEQNVRGCQEYNPRVYELPKEYQVRLRERGALEAEQREAEAEMLRERYFQQTTRPVLEVLHGPQERLFVVLGDPGAGKSVLLQYMALQWAELEPSLLATRPLPLLIELKTYAEHLKGQTLDFLEYLERGVGVCGRLEKDEVDAALQNGKATFLFDGLDEIFDEKARQRVMQEIARLTRVYPRARFVVTSRVVGYASELMRNAGFNHFMLQDLEMEQIERFIDDWHELAYTKEGERSRNRDRLKKAVKESKSIRELAQNPLLLTLMALLNRKQELPRERTELYEEASRLLLQQWDASRALSDDGELADQSFNYRDKQAMLRAVARRMQSGPKGLAGNAITRDDLEKTLTAYIEAEGYKNSKPIARRLIEQLHSRNFILCHLGDDFFAFVHRTFLEFFCASDLVWKFRDQHIDKEVLWADTFEAHWRDESWHEVLKLIVGQLEPMLGAEFIERLFVKRNAQKSTHLFLVAQCFADLRNRNRFEELSDRLRVAIQSLVKPYSNFAMLVITDRALTLLSTVWPDDKTRSWLQRQAEKFTNWQVVEALAQGWHDDPQTLPLILNCTRNDKHRFVRRAAVEALAQGWHDEPQTLPLMFDCAQNDIEWAVRRAAVEALAQGWRDEPQTLPLILDCARNDKDKYVRSAAVQALAQGWSDEPQTLPLILDCVQNDKLKFVRRAALEALMQGWPDEPQTLPLILDRAQHDNEEYVRSAAVEALAKGWRDEPQTLPLVLDCAKNDKDESVRSMAIEALVEEWPNNATVQDYLKSIDKRTNSADSA